MSLRRAARMHHLGIGYHHRGKPVLALIDETTVTVVHPNTGEIFSEHVIDPARSYWRNQLTPPGRWPQKRHHRVDAMERCGNRRPRVERLVSAWNQGIREDAESEDGADDPLIGASAEPKKRPRTRLTDKEVDAMRTARAQGVSVNALARRFGVHRGTVWAKTR